MIFKLQTPTFSNFLTTVPVNISYNCASQFSQTQEFFLGETSKVYNLDRYEAVAFKVSEIQLICVFVPGDM